MKPFSKNYFIVFLIVLGGFITPLSSCSIESTELSGDYMLWGDEKIITSKYPHYHNIIYPSIIDYAYDSDFIVAEQHSEQKRKDFNIGNLGENLFRRFQNYQLYNKGNNILNDSFYSNRMKYVKRDSVLYKNFIRYGSTDDESNNRSIGMQIAEYLIANDSYYKEVFGNKINYWIIMLSADSLIGPLTKTNYLEEKKKLGIPTNLLLKFEK